MFLSKYFKYEEFLVSSSYPIKDYVFTKDQKDIIRLGVESILDPLRERVGPVIITSGFRTPELNGLIGGSLNSDHLTANAVDLISNEDVRKTFSEMLDLPYRQLILYEGHVHVSWNIPGKKYKHEVRI